MRDENEDERYQKSPVWKTIRYVAYNKNGIIQLYPTQKSILVLDVRLPACIP
jgi:hypothetical protein